MSAPPEIRNLKEILEENLDGAKLIDYSTKYLTKPGDNYGSTMLGLSAIMQKGSDEPFTLEMVAKMPPETTIFYDMFQIPLTSVKENGTYGEIAATLLKHQKEANVPEADLIDVFPKCYGSRISLDPNAKLADSGSLLLLENLRFSGFTVGERDVGFDEETTFLILKNLSKFHAVPISLRYLKPEEFESNVNKFLNKVDMEASMDDELKENWHNTLVGDLNSIKEISHLVPRIINQIQLCLEHQKSSHPDTPFTTMVHNDFWVNNMMIKPNQIKIVDFQTTLKGSFVHDLIFFLFSSVQIEILIEKLDDFIEFYYKHFYDCLKQTGCPLDDFSYEAYISEVNDLAPYEMGHILEMLKVLMTKQESMPDEFKDMNCEMFSNENLVGQEYYERIRDILLLMDKKGWIMK